MVLKKRNVNVFQAVPFLLVAGSLSYKLLVLYQEIDILASIEYLKTKIVYLHAVIIIFQAT